MHIQRFQHGTNPTKIIAAIHQDGAVVIENVLSDQERGLLDQETAAILARADYCQGLFHGEKTKRAGGLIAKSAISQIMALNESVLAVMDHFLLPACDTYQINLTQLISIGPGEKPQVLHPDEGLFPYDHPGTEAMINVMWAVDDFTAANGATRVAPGSHLWDRDRQPEPHELTQATMKAGSCFIYLGSTVHGGGANTTDKFRRGIVMSYCLGWLRQAENQYLSVPLALARTLPERLQQLLGYFVHNPNLGAVNGLDPIHLLQNPDEPSRIQFRDFMTPEAQALLERHHSAEDSAAWSDLKRDAA